METVKTSLKDVRWIDLVSHADDRGVLTSIESAQDIPFEIKRLFYVHHVVADRGGHSHLDTDQVLIAISGAFMVNLDDGLNQQSFQLNDCAKGLYVPRRLFIHLYQFGPTDVCLVLASTHYDRSRSQRNRQDFLTMKRRADHV